LVKLIILLSESLYVAANLKDEPLSIEKLYWLADIIIPLGVSIDEIHLYIKKAAQKSGFFHKH
jgi:hypothetical protein